MKHVDIQAALPYGDPIGERTDQNKGVHQAVLASKENKPPTSKDTTMDRSKAKRFKSCDSNMKNKKYELRMTMIDRILMALKSDHPLTRYAAFEYTVQYEQIDDSIDETSGAKTNRVPSQSLIDCCLLAHRFYELQVLDLPSDIVNHDNGTLFQNWDYDEYIDNELTLLMILDYCLYPRSIAVEY
jgi:hypothetical protein